MRGFLTTLFVSLVVGSVLLGQSAPVQAQADQRCFTRKACHEARQTATADVLSEKQLEEGFFPAKKYADVAAACGGTNEITGKHENELGFCTTIGNIQTASNFGGKSKFRDATEVISFLFKYTFWAGTIVAVLVIIISGIQWMVSGGNTSIIGSAQQRIAGAITRLILLALSFTLLNTINPYLTQLKLPPTWMINSQGLVTPYCNTLGATAKLKETAYDGDITDQMVNEGAYTIDDQASTACGKRYLIEGAGAQTCLGRACAPANVCFKEPGAEKSSCHPGNVAGVIYYRPAHPLDITKTLAQADKAIINIAGDLVADFWTWPWVEDKSTNAFGISKQTNAIVLFCGGTDMEYIIKTEQFKNYPKTLEQVYRFTVNEKQIDNAIAECDGGYRGFAIMLGFNIPNDSATEAHILLAGKDDALIDVGDMRFSAIYGFRETEVLNNITHLPDEALFSKEELLQGVNLNIDAAKVCPVFNDEDNRAKCYPQFGY